MQIHIHDVLVSVHVLGAMALFAVLGIELRTQGRLLRGDGQPG